MMEKYFLFAGYYYYPQGGMNDLKAKCKNIDEAKSYICFDADGDIIDYDWAHVLNTETGEVIQLIQK